MDPITIAIVGALAGSAGKKVFDESYDVLKLLLTRKFGNNSEVIWAVNGVEAKPDSLGRRQTLEEELLAVKAHEDPEILQAAQLLKEWIGLRPKGGKQIAIGNNIAQADRRGVATVTLNSGGSRGEDHA